MPRVAIKSAREDPFYQGPGIQYVVRIKIFGSGMPADRPTDNSELTFEINFDQSLTENRAAARAAIIQNVRDQGITIADNARIDTGEQFFQSL